MLVPPRPEQLLPREAVEQMSALHVCVNTQAYERYLPNLRVELHGSIPLSFAVGMKGTEGRWDVWREGSWSGGAFGRASFKMFASHWLFAHICVRHSFVPFKEKSLLPAAGQTTGDLQNESRGLQWLQTSFRVLTGALESCQTNPDRLVTAYLKMTAESLAIQCFNLEITAVFRAEGVLSVVVFDDKNLGPGSAKAPALEADFVALKPAVLDEFIKLAALILTTAEARYR